MNFGGKHVALFKNCLLFPPEVLAVSWKTLEAN